MIACLKFRVFYGKNYMIIDLCFMFNISRLYFDYSVNIFVAFLTYSEILSLYTVFDVEVIYL